jgi:hypothetical protein
MCTTHARIGPEGLRSAGVARTISTIDVDHHGAGPAGRPAPACLACPAAAAASHVVPARAPQDLARPAADLAGGGDRSRAGRADHRRHQRGCRISPSAAGTGGAIRQGGDHSRPRRLMFRSGYANGPPTRESTAARWPCTGDCFPWGSGPAVSVSSAGRWGKHRVDQVNGGVLGLDAAADHVRVVDLQVVTGAGDHQGAAFGGGQGADDLGG